MFFLKFHGRCVVTSDMFDNFGSKTLTNQAPGSTLLGEQIPTDSDHLSLAMDVNLPPCLHGFQLPSFFV
jgi:hypothetical protein